MPSALCLLEGADACFWGRSENLEVWYISEDIWSFEREAQFEFIKQRKEYIGSHSQEVRG